MVATGTKSNFIYVFKVKDKVLRKVRCFRGHSSSIVSLDWCAHQDFAKIDHLGGSNIE